jgi:hypothetical protein
MIIRGLASPLSLARAVARAAVCLASLAACASAPKTSRYAPATASATGARQARGTTGVDVDLHARARTNRLRAVGTTATALDEGPYRGVRLADPDSAYRGQAMVWLDDVTIGEGVIELDIRGKDVFQRSFPGVAFHAAADSAFEVVYLRPFNFRAADPVRRQHAVQYMSLPEFDFDRLRKERPEEFENPVTPDADPNGWVHVRVELTAARVRVFVGEGADPDLVVEPLSRRGPGRVGLFNPGDFANLRVSPATP